MANLKYISIISLFFVFALSIQTAHTQSFCSTTGGSNSIGALKSGTAYEPCDIIPTGPFYIKIYVHTVGRDDGSGAPTHDQIYEAISILGADFDEHNIFFVWDCEIIRINSTTLFNREITSACDLPQYSDHPDGIDIFIGGDNAPYYASAVEVHSKAFIVKGRYSTFPSGACPGDEDGEWVASRSHIISHEMGHCLGLWHTHHGNEEAETCDGEEADPDECEELADDIVDENDTDCGDYVADTPADPGLGACHHPIYNDCEFGWTQYDSQGNQYDPDATLIMSYSHNKCMVAHSDGQGDRMRCIINQSPILLPTLVPPPTPPVIYTTQTIIGSPKWSTTNLPNNGEIFFNGTLTIQSGAKLTVNPSVIVYFSVDSEVIVEPNAQLILNGSTFTAQCGDTWEGIQVVGNTHLPQWTLNQGMVTMKNSATIEHAKCAILTAKRNPLGGPVLAGTTGGIVRVNNATFRDNKADVQFLSYVSKFGFNGSERSNLSGFTLSKSLLTDNYRFNNDDNDGQLEPFIVMDNVNGIFIQGHTFEDRRTILNDMRPSGKIGIESEESGFNINERCTSLSTYPPPPTCNGTPTEFINLDYGIYANRLSNNSFNISVKNSEFNTWHGIYLNDIPAAIQLNDFLVKEAINPATHSYGIYLDRCNIYSIENNDFDYESQFEDPNSGDGAIGIVVKNEHGDFTRIYRNNFDNFSVGIEAISQNRQDAPQSVADGLELRCNHFSNSREHDFFIIKDINNPDPTVPVGIKPIQDLPANLFSYVPQPITAHHIFNEPGIPNLEYIHHLETNDTRVKPIHTNPGMFGSVTVTGTNDIRGFGDCPDNFGTDFRLVSIDEGIIELSNIKNTEHNLYLSTLDKLNTLMDNGNTFNLVNSVVQVNREEALKVYDIIMQQAPFTSDEVLEEVSRKEEGFTKGMIRDILVAHPQAAKSAQIQQTLDNRTNLLFPFMRNQINGGINVISEKEQMQLDAAVHKRERDQAITDAIQLLASDTIDRSAEMIPFLSNTGNIGFDYHLAELYDQQENTELADKILAEIGQRNLSTKEADDYTYFTKFRDLMHTWEQEGKDLTVLDESDLAELQTYAKKHNVTAGKAITLLELNGNFDYIEPVYLPSELLLDPRSDELESEGIIKDKLSIYPNPVNDYFVLDYNIMQASDNISLFITDISGKIMYQQTLDTPQNEVIIRTNEFPAGQYFCTIKTDNHTINTEKFIIVK